MQNQKQNIDLGETRQLREFAIVKSNLQLSKKKKKS